MLIKKTINFLLKSLEKIKFGSIKIELPDGKIHHFCAKEIGPNAHLRLYSNDVIKNMAWGGDDAMVKDYQLGKWDSDDLISLVEFALKNKQQLHHYIDGHPMMRFFTNISYLLKINSLKGSRKNIHAHYDLGNQFYQLWLDDSMTYSSALFNNHDDDLTTAQENKYNRILQRIDETASSLQQKILEIGCGWGGFMDHSTNQSHHHIDGITISSAQYEYSQHRLHNKKAQANILLKDYRELSGKYDAIVSIEMFEAVGERYWNTYFSKIKSLLEAKGKAIIQTITINNDHFAHYRRGSDMIRSYIFPGGMLPSPQIFTQQANQAGLKIADQYCFGQDYAKTCTIWLNRFDAQIDHIRAQGFDDKFIRLWRLYLAFCAGGFKAGYIDVMQAELQHS